MKLSKLSFWVNFIPQLIPIKEKRERRRRRRRGWAGSGARLEEHGCLGQRCNGNVHTGAAGGVAGPQATVSMGAGVAGLPGGGHVCSVVSDSCDPVDCGPAGSSIHRTFQTRILE